MGLLKELREIKKILTEINEPKLNYPLLNKAGAVAVKLGEITRYGCGIGSGDNDYEYEDYNLFIRASTKPNGEKVRVVVRFGGEIVLSDNIYKEGIWEELLEEIYLSIPQVLKERKAQRKLEERKEELRKQIRRYKNDISFGQGVSAKISIFEISLYGKAKDEDYRIYENDQEVFHSNGLSVSNYIPGNWENVINEYEENIRLSRQRKIENEAIDDIKKLRLKRNN